MLTDGLCHQEIIHFTGTVNSCRTINDIRETGNALYIKFGFEFTKSISRIRHRRIICRNGRVIFFMHRSEYAQCADIDKLLRNHIECLQRINKIFSLKIIYIIKCFLVRTLGDSRTMNNVIKFVIRPFMPGELGTQFVGMSKVQFQKMNLPVLQILLAAARTDSRPHTKLSFQCLFDNKTSNESTCTCN